MRSPGFAVNKSVSSTRPRPLQSDCMPPTGNKQVNRCIELLCRQGCSEVYACIEALRSGEVFDEVATLDKRERQLVLQELVAIMAAYEGSCKG